MYKKYNSGRVSNGRSKFQNNSRGGFRNNFNRSSRVNHAGENINVNRFISKAIEIADLPPYQAVNAFVDFQISDDLKRNIIEKGYTIPTQIQDQTILPILEGRDVIGIANTGTGKTAAFLIPLIDKVKKNPSEKVIIVTPTRELAFQINEELIAFSRGLNISSVLCIGGSSMFRQVDRLRRNPQFVIGTPGRLKDHIQRKSLNLQNFRNVVLDEVDRMVDIGFIKDIKFMVSLLPSPRQSLFFSATVDRQTREILGDFVKDPITVSVKTTETSENINQDIIKVKQGQKVDQLHDLLTQEGYDRVMIFGRTKHGIEKLTKMLIERGFRAASIHGNKSQGQRQRALTDFKLGHIKLLLATDVASRGIDIDDVSHVINYDVPATYDDYVHRIGRTGRAGKIGSAVTFVD
ncbi:MAG TPA: DEAD/DEAH box helicase [Candidatus Limnocylindrales bacterium]|nr:DEAD/DEAH box helicase [Candidatus Limnocylindrales bacterium]